MKTMYNYNYKVLLPIILSGIDQSKVQMGISKFLIISKCQCLLFTCSVIVHMDESLFDFHLGQLLVQMQQQKNRNSCQELRKQQQQPHPCQCYSQLLLPFLPMRMHSSRLQNSLLVHNLMLLVDSYQNLYRDKVNIISQNTVKIQIY